MLCFYSSEHIPHLHKLHPDTNIQVANYRLLWRTSCWKRCHLLYIGHQQTAILSIRLNCQGVCSLHSIRNVMHCHASVTHCHAMSALWCKEEAFIHFKGSRPSVAVVRPSLSVCISRYCVSIGYCGNQETKCSKNYSAPRWATTPAWQCSVPTLKYT